MGTQDNPFGDAGSQYSATVSFGGSEPQSAAARDAAPAGGDIIKDTTTASFAADVIQESRRQPVLVDFWAPWCGPCRQLTPALEKAVRMAGGRIKLVKMNIDDHPSIAGQLGIQSIPAVIAFRDGQPVDGFMGAIPESQIAAFIKRVAGEGGAADVAELLAAAAAARETGDSETAAGIYEAILRQAPDNVDALAALADLLFDSGDAEAAESILAEIPEDKKNAPAVSAVRAKIDLARQAAEIGDPAALERRLAEDPSDHQARFDLAMVQNLQGKRDEAADNLLRIIKADRNWNDDGARSQLLKFFEAWGMTDPATLSARRKLSSLLFS